MQQQQQQLKAIGIQRQLEEDEKGDLKILINIIEYKKQKTNNKFSIGNIENKF